MPHELTLLRKRWLRSLSLRYYRGPMGTRKIEQYRRTLPPGEKLKVLVGGHWSDNPGWLLLDEPHQDITQPLKFPDNSVDVIFLEHVVEHVSLMPVLGFMRESLRVLKPGGALRIVCPMLEPMLAFDAGTPQGQAYVKDYLSTHFSEEDRALRALGLDGVSGFPKMFFLNALFLSHDHRWIWSTRAMRQTLLAVGFASAEVKKVGESVDPDYAIERRHRAIYTGSSWREDRELPSPIYDPESGVVEAIK